MRPPRLSLVLFLGSALTAGAACKVSLPAGLSTSGGSSSGSTAANGAPAAANGAPAAANGAPAAGPAATAPLPPAASGSLGAYYQGLDLAVLAKRFRTETESQIYDRTKEELGRDTLWKSPNPDPTWIKEWKQQDWTNASENTEIMFQAAFNRGWETACQREFAAAWKLHGDVAKMLTPALADVDAVANYYERIRGYAALYQRYLDAVTAGGADPTRGPLHAAGFGATILQHAVEFHAGSTHAFTAFPWQRFGATAEATREQGRALGDEAFERQAYCATAANQGGRDLPAFASIIDLSNTKSRRLAWPTVWGDDDAVRAEVRKRFAANEQQLATSGGARVEQVDKAYGVTFPDGEPKLAGFGEWKVVAAAAGPGGAVLTVERKQFVSYTYACRETRKIDRIENGRIYYRQNCKSGESVYDLTADVTFAELPAGTTFEKGDVVHFSADIEKSTVKVVKDTPAKKVTKRTLILTGRHLGVIERGRDKLHW